MSRRPRSEDLSTALRALARTATRRCDANDALVFRVDGDQLCLMARHGSVRTTRRIGDTVPITGVLYGLAVLGRRTLHIRDLAAAVRSRFENPEWARLQKRTGVRTLLAAPILGDGMATGVIVLRRTRVRPFTRTQIELAEALADQAALAIENARLRTEVRARTDELARAVARLTALAEVGRAVGVSLDLESVLTTIASRAAQLCDATGGTLWDYDEATEEFALRARNVENPALLVRRDPRVRKGEGAVGRLAITRGPVQIPDITVPGAYQGRLRDDLVAVGTRAVLAVPLVREDRVVGGLVVSRRTPGAFSPEIVEVLRTLAAQSTLAIQHARFLHELEEQSRRDQIAQRA